MKTKQEKLHITSTLAQELIYSMKLNFGTHAMPQDVSVYKLNPMFRGTKE